jgi:hypothetical protein
MVRRLLDPDPATGQRRFTAQAFLYTGYQSSDLAYAVTGHSAQGATVHTGIALVTGTEDRQWLYPAMTRGIDTKLAFVFTTPARPANPQPGTWPAPELDRYERIRQERAGDLPGQFAPGSPGGADPREPVAVLADVLGRDGAELSASGRNCGCRGSAPSTPPWAPSAPPPKPPPPARPVTSTAPRGTRPWLPATGPCATATSSENRPSPKP